MRQFQTTGKYLQGPDLITRLGDLVKEYGDRIFILTSNSGLDLYSESIKSSFEKKNIKYKFEKFNGEVTYEEVERLQELVKEFEADCVIGLGAGKVVDAAKCAGFFEKTNVVIVPTIASSDAPVSSVSVMYNDAGNVVGVEYFSRNPDLTVVDTQAVADAPIRYFKAGVGDALSTYFDARINYRNKNKNVFGTDITRTGLGMAQVGYEVLLEDGLEALWSCEMGIVSEALENVVETTTLISGAGFENCGISCSHSIQDALTEIEDAKDFLHGEKVTFGSFCTLLMDDPTPQEIEDFLMLCANLDLPITLKQLGIEEDAQEKIQSVMDVAFQPQEDSVYHMPPGSTKESVYATIFLADKLGTEFLKEYKK